MCAALSDPPLVLVAREHDDFHVMRSRDGRYFRLSKDAFRVARLYFGGASADAIGRDLASDGGGSVSEAQIARTCARLAALGEERAKPLDARILFRLTLVPARMVRAIASRLTFMFSPAAMLAVAAVLASGLAAAARIDRPLAAGGPQVVGALLLVIASLLIHEFGHAAAAKLAGVEPEEIGLTIFAVFPALYTDVTAAWALKRRGRVLIDCGGVYFHALAIGLIAWAYAATRAPVFAIALAANLASALFALNPFAKNDGYWIVADALGLANLAVSSRRWLGSLMKAGPRGAGPPGDAPTRRREDARRIAGYVVFLFCSTATWLWLAANIGRAAFSFGTSARLCLRTPGACLREAGGSLSLAAAMQIALVLFYLATLAHSALAKRSGVS